MKRASSFEAYARAPQGQALVGEGWLTFCHGAALWGFALWGRTQRGAAEGLLAALALELRDDTAPHASLVDASRLEAADAGSFEALTRYVERHRAALARKVTRLAIVHPGGFEGAVVSGFFRVLEPPYPVTLAGDLGSALRDLGATDPSLGLPLSRAIDEAAGTVPLLGAARALLRDEPDLALADAARVLRVSARTLQRRLGEHGTHFSQLAASVRLEVAMERIETSTDALTTIALDAGFASPQHMSRAVRAATGLTPSALRERAPKSRAP